MDSKFKINDEVIVDSRSSTGHCRTPAYIRGKKGIIERICGRFPNPEEIALCKKDPKIVTLYRCRFKQMDVWDNYSGKDSNQTSRTREWSWNFLDRPDKKDE